MSCTALVLGCWERRRVQSIYLFNEGIRRWVLPRGVASARSQGATFRALATALYLHALGLVLLPAYRRGIIATPWSS